MAIITVTVNTIYDLIDLSVNQTIGGTNYGRGTSSDPLKIIIADDLDFNDIDPNGEYAPYIYSWNGFNGTWYATVEGNKHSIKNISYMGTANWAFIQGTGSNITVQNLILEDMNITTSNAYYGLVSSGTIYGCKVSGIINCKSANCIGAASLIRDSCFIGDVTASGTPIRVFGQAGSASSTAINSFVRANIKAMSNSNPYIYLLNANSLNCFFIGTYTYANGGSPTTHLEGATSTANYCYLVLTNIADLLAAGFQSDGSVFPSNSAGCCYETIASENTDPDTGNPIPAYWYAESIDKYHAELSLKTTQPFIDRGYAIR